MDNQSVIKSLIDKSKVAQKEFEKFDQQQVDAVVKDRKSVV